MAPLVLLAIVSAYALFMTANPVVQEVFVPCLDDPARVGAPFTTRLPLLGRPLCCLASFFEAVLDSSRSKAIMAEILTFIGALLSISTLESARRGNQENYIIANPMVPWLVFNLAGGAVVWQLVIVSAFLYHTKRRHGVTPNRHKYLQQGLSSSTVDNENPTGPSIGAQNPSVMDDGSQTYPQQCLDALTHAEDECSMPLAIAMGYFGPSLVLLLWPSHQTVTVWLFFPVYVTLLRRSFRLWYTGRHQRQLYKIRWLKAFNLGQYSSILQRLFALPMWSSIVARLILLYHISAIPDDRSIATIATLRFVQLDTVAIATTVAYWVVMVRGFKQAGFSLLAGCLLGPGFGLCLAWLVDEEQLTG